MRKNRESRLKFFKTKEEAEFFSLHGRENVISSPPESDSDTTNGDNLSENESKSKINAYKNSF